MRKISVALLFFLLIGCSNTALSGSKPPAAMIKIGGETYLTTLGTYCWSSGNSSICVDTAGPVDLLEGKEPIQVKPGEEITFVMDYKPMPNEVHVIQISDKNETEVSVKNNRFTAPTEPGIYYYSYGVWWMDEKQENVSHGDAFYAFVIEVK